MHRLSHRSLVLVPALLLAAACSKGDEKAGPSSPLDRDLTLSAQLQGTGAPSGVAELVANGACRAERAPAAPTTARRNQALALEQRAAEAEFVGNIGAARTLHRQAARLDGTSEAIAYRLARADEASGDSAAAVAGYCHYLSLAPAAANAQEVRTRLSALLGGAAATRFATAPAAAPATRTVAAATSPVSRASGRRIGTQHAAAQVVAQAPAASPAPPVGGSESAGTTESANVSSSSGEVVATNDQPTPPPPSEPTPQVRRPADHTARNAAIGAVIGGAVGGMTSHSMKGAVLGGMAGGVLGAVVGRVGNSGLRTPGFAH